MAKVKEVEEKEIKIDRIDKFLKETKLENYGCRSGLEIEPPDIIPTGSCIYDLFLDGGFRSSSWMRFIAEPESGKTSQGLCWGKQWQDYYKEKGKKGVVIYFNAEGRISKDLIIRSGIDTTKDIFRIIDTNLSELIYDIIEELIHNNSEDARYFFILDSNDACKRLVDKEKSYEECDKTAGGASILSVAARRLSLIFSRTGHVMYICSQVRDNMKSKFGGKKPSGGWAPQFYSSLTATIEKSDQYNDGIILENPSDKNSKQIGKLVTFRFDKTFNEKTGQKIQVPVKFGHIGGIWRAYEAMILAEPWGFLKVGATGHSELHEQFCEELISNKIPFEQKFRGLKATRDHFDHNPELVEFILTKGKMLF